MRRALLSSLLSLLLLTTLVWGGCLSCEQFFMWPGAKTCCGADGQCKTKQPEQSRGSRGCKQIAFEHQKSLDLHVHLPVPVSIGPFEFLPRIAGPFTASFRPTLIEPSPPDLQVLHATFLI